MNVRTRRWLLAPIRQWRTHQLIRRHGPSLDYPTAWALITWPRPPTSSPTYNRPPARRALWPEPASITMTGMPSARGSAHVEHAGSRDTERPRYNNSTSVSGSCNALDCESSTGVFRRARPVPDDHGTDRDRTSSGTASSHTTRMSVDQRAQVIAWPAWFDRFLAASH